MASYFLLYNCVVLSVFFGSVLCGGTGNDSTTDPAGETDEKIKILDVTLIRHLAGDKTLKGGVIQSEWPFPNAFDTCWEFYESRYWNRKNGGSLTEDATGSTYLLQGGNGFYETERQGKTVYIKYRGHGRADEHTIRSQIEHPIDYTLIFATKNDAMTFTGENNHD